MLVAAGVLPGIEPHRDDIGAQVKVGVSAATIHQRLVEEHGLSANVASVRRWVRANLPEDARRAAVTVLRDTPPPGEEARIDYGRLGMWTDPHTGRRRTVWAFVVDRPDLYDPKINRSYVELAAHDGALVDPARALKPKDKARVERPMPYVCDSFGRRPLRTHQRTSRPLADPDDQQPLTSGLVPPGPQPRRRRIPTRPTDQQQPPTPHERSQLPTHKQPGRAIPQDTTTPR